jgi:hypothetical protein
LANGLNNSETVKIAAAARYLPITMSKSAAGSVRSSSSVPCRRSSAQMLIVIAGMKTSMIRAICLLSWSRFARLATKNSCGQKAAADVSSTNRHKKT